MRMSEREKVLAVILAVLLIGVVSYQYVYAAQRTEIQKLEAELKANGDKYASLTARQKEADKYLKNIRSLDAEIRSIEREVPYTKDMPGALVEIYYMLSEHGLQSESISFSNISKGDKYDYFNIVFELNGKKHNVNNFLRQLDNFERKLTINSISMVAVGTEDLSVKLDLKVYLLKDSEPHAEPEDYEFMEGNFGDFGDIYQMFKATEEQNSDGGEKNEPAKK